MILGSCTKFRPLSHPVMDYTYSLMQSGRKRGLAKTGRTQEMLQWAPVTAASVKKDLALMTEELVSETGFR